MSVGDLIRTTRKRKGISQRSLALRAGTDQAAVSRIEAGRISPSLETAERLLQAMGMRLEVEATALEGTHDPVHLRSTLQRTPEERLELAISWNRLAGRLAAAGRAEHAE